MNCDGKVHQCHNGQSLLTGLKAYVGSVEMKAQVRIKPQRRIAPHDQKQLVKRRDAGRQLGSIEEQAAAVVHPADPHRAEPLRRIIRHDHLTDPIHSRNTDRPKPSLGLLELLSNASVPTIWQEHILMHASDPLVPGLGDGQVDRSRGLGASWIARTSCGEPGPARHGDLCRLALRIALSDTQTTNDRGGTLELVARRPVPFGAGMGLPAGTGSLATVTMGGRGCCRTFRKNSAYRGRSLSGCQTRLFRGLDALFLIPCRVIPEADDGLDPRLHFLLKVMQPEDDGRAAARASAIIPCVTGSPP